MIFGYRKFVPKSLVLQVKWLFGDPCRPARRALSTVQDVQPSCQTVDAQEKLKQNTAMFNDTKSAYRSKTTREILRALLVFRLCSVNFLVDNNLKVCSNYVVLISIRIVWML
jgi:hypothetical protein